MSSNVSGVNARVVSFDESTLVGEVAYDLTVLRFHSTSFQSDSSFRWPRVGEKVFVVFNSSGELLSVHAS